MMLPSQSFHRSTLDFVRLFQRTDSLRYKRIVDCGAGLDVTAVDHNAREGEVVRADLLSYEFDFDRDSLVLLCHGPFVSMFLDRVLRECPHVLYE